MFAHKAGLTVREHDELQRFVHPTIAEPELWLSVWDTGLRRGDNGAVPEQAGVLDEVGGGFGVKAEDEG